MLNIIKSYLFNSAFRVSYVILPFFMVQLTTLHFGQNEKSWSQQRNLPWSPNVTRITKCTAHHCQNASEMCASDSHCFNQYESFLCACGSGPRCQLVLTLFACFFCFLALYVRFFIFLKLRSLLFMAIPRWRRCISEKPCDPWCDDIAKPDFLPHFYLHHSRKVGYSTTSSTSFYFFAS